jgi:predicted metal-dependent HD superfamily phosphohydrolase
MEFLVQSATLALTVFIPGIDEDEVMDVLTDIILRYEEPWRHYHSLPHVVAILRELSRVIDSEAFDRMGELEVARLILMCLYHDIIYVPGAKSNEILSAQYVKHFAIENHIPLEKVAPVIRGITASANHFVRGETLSATEHLFLDADLSILAASDWGTYTAYVGDVCSEYEAVGVTAEQFFKGRITFLRSALENSSGAKFFHAHEFDHMNGPAEANIRRELEMHEEE